LGSTQDRVWFELSAGGALRVGPQVWESMPMIKIRNLIAAAKWDKTVSGGFENWWSSAFLRHYVNEQICGEGGREEGVAVALQNHLDGRRLTRALSIGCGNANKEMKILQAGAVENFDLFDIAPAQIASGKNAMAEANLSGQVHFLENSPLDAPAVAIYDLIYWDHSLHHMQDVRSVLRWCKASLASGGILCINDYVGPSRLQWRPREVDAVNALLGEMETKHATAIEKATRGSPVKRIRQILKDPSEAPESHLIENAVSDVFPGFQLRPLGGAMLNICGSMVMNLPEITPGLLKDFAEADRRCLNQGIYHFAFGIWDAP
jgi:SAM-dependent methyltransferase